MPVCFQQYQREDGNFGGILCIESYCIPHNALNLFYIFSPVKLPNGVAVRLGISIPPCLLDLGGGASLRPENSARHPNLFRVIYHLHFNFWSKF